MNYKRQLRVISTPNTLMVITCIVLMIVNYSVHAQPTFGIANVTEAVNPSALPNDIHNTSAYAIPTGGGDKLCVHTWDGGDQLTGSAGILVQEYDAGTSSYINAVRIDNDDWASIEAVIIEESGTYYIVMSYYHIINQQFEVDVLEYDNSTIPVNLNPVTGYPLPLSPTSLPFGWIRIDAIDLTHVGITWATNGSLFTVVGITDPTNILDLQDVLNFRHENYNGFDQPDIALTRANNGDELVFITCTDDDADELIVFGKFLFSDLFTAAGPAYYNPNVYHSVMSNGKYFLPRIDAPDIIPDYNVSGNYAWSVVYNEQATDLMSVAHNYIRVLICDNLFSTGTVIGRTLNDGTMLNAGISPMVNITTGSLQENIRPVVAFDNFWRTTGGGSILGNNIYYGWFHKNGETNTNLHTDDSSSYIGVALKTNGDFHWTGDDYFVIPEDPSVLCRRSAIAFSGNNDASNDGLYMSFTQIDGGAMQVAFKDVPWTNTSFRPTPNPKDEVAQIGLAVYPNPFGKGGFKIEINNNPNDQYTLTITDILGREMLHITGAVNELNDNLSTTTANWQTGQYILQLKNIDTGYIKTVKIVSAKD